MYFLPNMLMNISIFYIFTDGLNLSWTGDQLSLVQRRQCPKRTVASRIHKFTDVGILACYGFNETTFYIFNVLNIGEIRAGLLVVEIWTFVVCLTTELWDVCCMFDNESNQVNVCELYELQWLSVMTEHDLWIFSN